MGTLPLCSESFSLAYQFKNSLAITYTHKRKPTGILTEIEKFFFFGKNLVVV